MPSLSKQLIKSLEKYTNEIPRLQLINCFNDLSPEKKLLVYQRGYNHLYYGLPGFAWLYRRAAQFAPTYEVRDYLLSMFDKFQQSLEVLETKYKQFAPKDDINTINPTAICFPLQSYESEYILCKKDVVLFLASHLGLIRVTGQVLKSMPNEFRQTFGWVLEFDSVAENDLMADWIDRLAPKDWTQEYFETLRNACERQVALDFPSKYNYMLTGINAVPQVVFTRRNFD